MPGVTIRHEFPSSLHVAVKGAKSERSAVQLARNFATKHYGVKVDHYVSSGWSEGAHTYVYSNPSYVDEPLPDLPLKLVSTRQYTRTAKPAARNPKHHGRNGYVLNA